MEQQKNFGTAPDAGLGISYESLANTLPCGILRCLYDENLTIIFANDFFISLTGYTRQELESNFSNGLKSLIYEEDLDPVLEQVISQLATGDTKEIDYRLVRKDGKKIWVMDRGQFFPHENGPGEFYCIIMDISQRQKKIEKLTKKARLDSLTKLNNKEYSKIESEEYLAYASAKDLRAAMVILDIDDFKSINDTYGHLFADSFLVDTANILVSRCAEGDIIGRVGGDEMMVLMKNPASTAYVEKTVSSILSGLLKVSAERIPSSVSCSAGISLFPEDGGNYDTLFRKADQALYLSKCAGKNRYNFFSGTSAHQSSSAPAPPCFPEPAASQASSSRFLRVFQIMNETHDFDTCISRIFSFVGSDTDVSRIYIFEDNGDGTVSNTYEWCAAGISPEKDRLQNLPKSAIQSYYDTLRENGDTFYCSDTSCMNEELKAVVLPQGIKSMIVTALCHSGTPIGFIGFDDCRTARNWSNSRLQYLNVLAKIIEMFLYAHRLEEKFNTAEPAMRDPGQALSALK